MKGSPSKLKNNAFGGSFATRIIIIDEYVDKKPKANKKQKGKKQ